MNDDALTFHYHTRYCDGECIAHDPDRNVTHQDMAERLQNMRDPDPR